MFVSQTNLGLVFGKGRIAYITRTLRDLLSHPIPVDLKRNVRRPIQLEVIGAHQQGAPQQGHLEQVVSYQTSYQNICQRPSQITSERASHQGPEASYQVASQQQGAPAQTHFPSIYFPFVEPGQPANQIIKDYRNYLTQPAQYQRESTQAFRSQGGPSDSNLKRNQELEAIVMTATEVE
jgi:hypothetical protein